MFAVRQKKHYLCNNNFRHASLQCVPGQELIFYTPMETYTKQPISIVDQMEMLNCRPNGNVEKQGTSV